jgi:predicted ATPase/class 3 adenylate cyclase/predicted negative regulator of RcsB-dependent stress response
MAAQPAGTVTMLFSDVEGSTLLLGRLGASGYAAVLGHHNKLLREVFNQHGGYEVDTAGDSFFVSFGRAADAASAAAEAQRALAAATWPDGESVRVRMAIHTGEPLVVEAKYVGMDVHRAARIMSAAHGGQVLVSESTAALLDGIPLRDLGLHRLKDLLAPIRLFQLEVDALPGEFPPPRSLNRTNLPTASWPLVGREHELARIQALILEGVRLLTLTGPGGAGKTRLALQAAAEFADEFPDGVYFVPLSPLRDVSMVPATIAEAVGLGPDAALADALRMKRMLLLLDNLEHLPGIAAAIADVLVGESVVLATSRTPLRLSGEREVVVDPLPDAAAVELFVSRAAAAGREVAADEAVAAVCRRLDNLPLALELAAARAKLLPPAVLMQRLDSALPLLTGGAADRPARQQTLRATIEWSHELLDQEAQMTFRRLSAFRGSFTLGAAETVTAGGLAQLETLLDQSLIKPFGEDRFFLLETIREYARERLDVAGETADVTLRHAHYYLNQLRERRALVFGPHRGTLLSWFGEEQDNLRAALDRLKVWTAADAAEMSHLLAAYWSPRGELHEARQEVAEILAIDGITRDAQALLLSDLAEYEERLGDFGAASSAATRALAFAEEVGDKETASFALVMLASLASRRGDLRRATELLVRALEEGSDDEWTRALVNSVLAEVHLEAGRDDEARDAFESARAGFRATGDETNHVTCAIGLAQLELYCGNFEAAAVIVEPAVEWAQRTGDHYRGGGAFYALGFAELGRGRRLEARAAFGEGLDLVLASDRTGSRIFVSLLAAIAFAAEPGAAASAARLLQAADRLSDERGFAPSERDEAFQEQFRKALVAATTRDRGAAQHVIPQDMSLKETIALANALLLREPDDDRGVVRAS